MTNDNKRYDLLCVLDSYCVGQGYVRHQSAVSHVCIRFNEIAKRYNIQFKEALTDQKRSV